MQRYIATTSKHEHKFTVSILVDLDTLNGHDYSRSWTEQSGWTEYCGTAVWYGPCPTCGRNVLLTGHAVIGRYKADRKCDARCTSANGHDCECQCGGKNHGADHAA